MSVSQMIYEALCTLLIEEKRDYNDLSIQDIVEKAGVCRNSFYRNYDSKDDILISKFNRIFLPDAPKNMENDPKDAFDFLYGVFSLIKENRRFFLAFYYSNTRKYFEMISSYLIATNTSQDITDVGPSDYYHYASKVWISLGLFTEWIIRNCDLPVDELCDQILNYDFTS
jgi:AcrR family transcriptional regulator